MNDWHEMTEVERLRHENECLNATIAQSEHPCSPHCYEYLNELRLRNRIEALTAEVERLNAGLYQAQEIALKAWADKTEWVQQTCQNQELGLHRADVLRYRIEALTAENERLREALDAAWKQATTMRNASKLVGPYPNDLAKHSVWVRALYHEGKRLHELLKPARAALEGKQ